MIIQLCILAGFSSLPRTCRANHSSTVGLLWLCLIIPQVLTQTLHLYILREKSLAIYFEDSQLRTNKTFSFIVSKIYVDKRSRV